MTTKYFESLQEMLEFLETPNLVANLSIKRGSSYNGRHNWFGTESMQQAKQYALEGWHEGTAAIEKFTSMFLDKLTNSLKIDEYYYDVTGQDFDLDRVLIGEPEAWLNTEQVEVIAPANHNVKILVNVGALVGVSEETIITKGSAIAALVMLLERARRSVTIEAVSKCVGSVDVEVRILVKKAGDQLDLAKIAFVLANAAFLRRFVFGVRERIGTPSERQSMRLEAYGRPTEVLKGDEDIYCPIEGGAMYFNSEKQAEKWILEQLKNQGVELKEGV